MSVRKGRRAEDDEQLSADGTGPKARELSVDGLLVGAMIGFVIALVRPRSWR